jgi:hypothetical protein
VPACYKHFTWMEALEIVRNRWKEATQRPGEGDAPSSDGSENIICSA